MSRDPRRQRDSSVVEVMDTDVPPSFMALQNGLGSEEDRNSWEDCLLDSSIHISPQTSPARFQPFQESQMDTDVVDQPGTLDATQPQTPLGTSVRSTANATSDDSMESALSGIEPSLNLDSSEMKRVMETDPRLVEETLSSVESHPSRNNSGQFMNEEPRGGATGSSERPIPQVQLRSSVTSTVKKSSNTTKKTDIAGSPIMATEDTSWLPGERQFKVMVQLTSHKVVQETVDNDNGCLLYSTPAAGPAPAADGRTLIPIAVHDNFPWLPGKQRDYTGRILRSCERGVVLWACGNGDIYARRLCETHIYWSSTQEDSNDQAEKLERDQDTRIFNYEEFEEQLGQMLGDGKQHETRLPAVWFSFAQKWDRTSCPLTSKLVWARIEPAKAAEMVQGLNPDVKSTAYYESLHSSNILISS